MNLGIIDNFSKKCVLVIGDIMLDRYIYGHVDRISPEAPVPIVKVNRKEDILGGAANVANNISSLGCNVLLAGICGKDDNKDSLFIILKEKNIDYSLVLEDPSRPTIVKERVVAGNNYQLLRMDYEKTADINEATGEALFRKIKEKISKIDAIIISDYAKGCITEKLSRSLIKLANENKKPIIIDGKPKHLAFFKDCTLITPNLKEAIEMTSGLEDVTEMGKFLVDTVNCNVFIKRGGEGISVFDKNNKHTHVPSMNITKIFDVTGAGDTVIAVAALGLISGLDFVDSAVLANAAAGIVVQKPGTSVVSPDELRSNLNQEISHYLKESIDVKQKIIDKQVDKIESAASLFIDAYKHKNKIIAFGNGGSASDAQHLVGELVGRFKTERRSLSAIALTTDSSVITAIANDYGYDYIFERQIEANAQKGDVVVGISTSGNSPNVLNAIKKAKELGCKTIGLTGKDGGKLQGMCDVVIVVPSDNTPRIQEAHIAIIHIICELLDKDIGREKK
jgi:D-glycero-beta-D-manno-heptose-7-phosphate kinase